MNCLFLETLGYESALRLSGHHYARLCAEQGHRVLSISSPVTLAHWLRRNRLPSIARRFQAHSRGFAPPHVASSGAGLLHYVPFAASPVHRRFPFNTTAALNFSAASYRRDLLAKMSALDFAPELISIQSMMFAPLLDAFSRAKLWYRMEDLLAGFPDMPRSMLAAESRVMDRADLITVTSPLLLNAVPEVHHPKTLVLPNGVDFAHFLASEPRPREYAAITKPIALYVGALRSWFNWEWLEAASRALPGIQFVLISPDSAGDIRVEHDNLLHIPGVPYENLPAYIQHAAVGMIPFKPSPLIDAVSPIKLFEFFACGKPVVSTSWKTLEDLRTPAFLARDAGEFTAALARVIDQAFTIPADQLTNFARAHSWTQNLSAVMDKLQSTSVT